MEERELTPCWENHLRRKDPTAREKLITHYQEFLRIRAAVAYRRRIDQSIGFDEFMQFGQTALIECIDRFDPTAGARFETYARKRLDGAILDGIAAYSEMHRQVTERRRLIEDRVEGLVDDDSPDDALARLAEVAIGLAVGFMLDGTGMMDDGGVCYGDAASELQSRQLVKRVRELVAELEPRERQIITQHYFHGTPFQDIAREQGITKGRISQLHRRALQKLAESFRTPVPDVFEI